MNIIFKLIILGILAAAASYIGDRLSEPPPSEASLKYHEEYKSKSDTTLSEEEFERLKLDEKKYIEEITSSASLKSDFEHILKRKIMVIPISIMFWLLVGIYYGFKYNRYIVAGVVIIVLVSLININIFESALYGAIFLIGNIIYNRTCKERLKKPEIVMKKHKRDQA
jgi:hypothetical protein